MSLVDDVIATAHAKIGSAYVLGTEGPTTFDCSGLVWYCFNHNGGAAEIGGSRRRAAGYTRWFADHGQFTRDFRRAERGDLIVYEHPVGHIGIYLGGGQIISALVPPYGVKQTRYNGISVPFYGVLMVDYGAGRTDTDDAPDTVGDEPDTIFPSSDPVSLEDAERDTGRALWHIEFEDRPRRAMGAPDVVNKITRRRPPPPEQPPETGTTDGSPLVITTMEAKRDLEQFDAAEAHDDFTYAAPGAGPRPGSFIQHWVTQANPDWPCVGLGIFYWTGRITAEVWYEVDLSAGIDPDSVGIRFSSATGANPVDTGLTPDGKSAADHPFVVAWGQPDPTALQQWTLLGQIDPFNPWDVLVPRSLLTAARNALVIAPDWLCGGSFCGTELASNTVGPLIGGEGQSRRYLASSDVSITAAPVTITGTGKTQWVAGDGDIDGTNDTFSLVGWDGTGVPEVRVDGLIAAAADYTFDTGALTVTLAAAPPAGAFVAFRYNHS